MTETEIYTAPVRDGAMLSAPVYEGHKRGKNWMAIINPDPTAPGGVARTFVPRGRGEYYYIVSTDLVGQPEPLRPGPASPRRGALRAPGSARGDQCAPGGGLRVTGSGGATRPARGS